MTGGVDILALHALGSPDKPVLINQDGVVTTYSEFNARVNRCASALLGLGLKPGETCLHIHYNRPEAFELAHALRKIRAITTPMNYRLRGGEVAYILNDSGARAIVAGEEFIPLIDEARAEIGDAGDRLWIAFGDKAPEGWLSYEEILRGGTEAEPETPSEITGPSMIYTAGTTGNPKGALRRDGADPAVVMQWIQWFNLGPSDVHLLAGPGYHSAPAAFAGVHTIVGATVVVEKTFEPELSLRLIEQHRVTTTFMAPILVKRILDLPAETRARYDVSSMRALIVAAAPFPGDLKRRAVEYFGDNVYEFYGATESGLVTVMTPEDLLRKPESCGRVVDGAEVLFLDDEGNEVEPGEPGELWARSAAIFGEYLNKPDATSKSKRDGFFTAGDIAYQDDEGFVYICDRKIDMIISGGVNIYPAEVESVLHGHPAVEDCAVIGVPDKEWGESVKAVVKLHDVEAGGTDTTADELIAFVRDRVAGYKVPRSVDFVDDFPRDPAGKLLKRLIRDRYWEASGTRI
ncbi:MAG TPA: AMP-binding protein [Candidatus Dormibacteraeota bacterium]|nr:AMP-binding protein [Candidatus Dormibacteraeota bacterium]